MKKPSILALALATVTTVGAAAIPARTSSESNESPITLDFEHLAPDDKVNIPPAKRVSSGVDPVEDQSEYWMTVNVQAPAGSHLAIGPNGEVGLVCPSATGQMCVVAEPYTQRAAAAYISIPAPRTSKSMERSTSPVSEAQQVSW